MTDPRDIEPYPDPWDYETLMQQRIRAGLVEVVDMRPSDSARERIANTPVDHGQAVG